jgi:monoamine oxidase
MLAEPLPVAWAVSHWAEDPWARGSWSGLLVGGTAADRARLGEPVGDRLVLAGEAIHPTAPAMAHGAYESGAAAGGVVDALARPGERVVVVGAGAAGLAAARALAAAGREVLVLEAQDRVGGRLHTVPLGAGVAADLGGAWLEQYEVNPLAVLAADAGLATVPTDFSSPTVAAADGPVDGGQLRGLLDGLEMTAGRMTVAGDCSLDDAVTAYAAGLSDDDRRGLDRAVEAALLLESGLDPRQASARGAFGEPGTGAGDHWLPGGYGQLVALLGEGLTVRCEHPVRLIRHGQRGAEVAGPWGTERCDRVVLAVPVALLGGEQEHGLVIAPGLPRSHARALARIGTGVVEKVLLRYPRRWWPATPGGYLWWFDAPLPTWTEWADLTDGLGEPVLALLAAGAAARRLHAGRPDEAVAADAHAAVVRYARAASR